MMKEQFSQIAPHDSYIAKIEGYEEKLEYSLRFLEDRKTDFQKIESFENEVKKKEQEREKKEKINKIIHRQGDFKVNEDFYFEE